MRYFMSWYNGKIHLFRSGGSAEIFDGESWKPFVKPEGFTFTEHPLPIAGSHMCLGGERFPNKMLEKGTTFIPEPNDGENGLEALIRVYEPLIKERQNELAKMRLLLLTAKRVAATLILFLLLLGSSAIAQDLYWYTGERVNVLESTAPGLFRKTLETVYNSGFTGAVIEIESKNTSWVGSAWEDTLNSVLDRFDTTRFEIILQTRNVSKHPYGAPASVPTCQPEGLSLNIDHIKSGIEYGERVFTPISLGPEYSNRSFNLIVSSTGKARLYILRSTKGDPFTLKADFSGVDTFEFHTLENSTGWNFMLQGRDKSGEIEVGVLKIEERYPSEIEVLSSSPDYYEFVGNRGMGFYYSRTLDVENREAVWKSYETSRDMQRAFGHHPCIVATWHSADEVFMYGHQKFKWFHSGGEAYTFLVDEGIRFDNLIWNKPVWLWADHRKNGHNVKPFTRACVGMDGVYEDTGLDQVEFAWNEGDLVNEVRRMRTPGMAVTLGTDNLDSAYAVAKECGVKKVIFEAWSDYSPGSSRSKWLTKLPEIVSTFRKR
jgi:hypothetical protein